MLVQYPRLKGRGLLCILLLLLLPACFRCIHLRKAQPEPLDQQRGFDASVGYRPFLRSSPDDPAVKTCTTDYDNWASGNTWSVDIPVPVTAQLYPAFEKKGGGRCTGLQVAYLSPSDIDEIYAFYTREMVLYGWQEQLHIAGIEHIILFEKPGRRCVISIRQARMMSAKIARKKRTFFVILSEKI